MKRQIIIQGIVWLVIYLLFAYLFWDVNWLVNRSQEGELGFRFGVAFCFLGFSTLLAFMIHIYEDEDFLFFR